VGAFLDEWLAFVRGTADRIPGGPVVWLVLFVAARLAYVGYIGYWLRAQDRRGALTARWGDAARERFARRGSWLMNVDGVCLGIAIGKHAGEIEGPRTALFVLGVALVAFGIFVTIASARALGIRAWLWEDFFGPSTAPWPPRGIYRWVDDPKYVLGYAHAYGWALMCFSATGLGMALFAHAAILAYNRIVERPHYLALKSRPAGVPASAPARPAEALGEEV
jgi:hypothetical protein